jgi:hypothetical protein
MFSATARHVSRCRTGRPRGKPAGSIEEDQEKKIGKEEEEERCAGTGEENPREEQLLQIGRIKALSAWRRQRLGVKRFN